VKIKQGKNIAEASVTDITKGSWIAAALERYNATAAIFIGDDTTDEDGFKVLSERDMSVKVGEGETAATSRVPDIEAVGALLQQLAHAREAATA
jgi:trehalose 6-phosphate phosphatase